jgi:monothiol glutaredoxin
MRDDVRKKIEDTIGQNKVVLFMKGTKNFPQCGFSARVVQALKNAGEPFTDVARSPIPRCARASKSFVWRPFHSST